MKGDILDCNNATEILSGFTKKDLIGNNFLKVSGIPDKYMPLILEDYKAIINGENPARREIQLYRKGGDLSWVIYHASKIILNYEKLILLIVQDISEQKKIEQKLKDSEKKYRLLVENAHEGIWAIDAEAKTTYVNKRMAEIFGYTEEEMIGKHLFEFMDESGVEKAKFNLERRKNGIKEQHDFEFLRKDGTKVCTSLETSPILDDKGIYNGAIACVADITERKRVEEKLRLSEKKYWELFNNMSSGVAVYDAINNGEDFIFRDLNLTGERIDKIKKEKLIGKSIQDIFPGIRDFGLFDIFKEVWKTGNAMYHPIGQYTDDRITGWRENFVYKLPTGEIVAVYDDITERKKNEFELEIYRMDLENLVKERTSELEELNKQLFNEMKERKQTLAELDQIFNSSFAMCVIDKNYEIIRINDTYTHFFRTNKEKVIGKKCYEIMDYDNCHTPRCTLKWILDGALLVEREKRKEFSDGDEIYYIIRATPYKDSDGEVIGMVETYSDITDRIRIENAVIESEEKYRLISETAHDLIRVVNERFKIEYINESAHLKLLGYTKDEFFKRMRTKIVHPDEIKAGIKFFRQIIKEGESVREGRFRHKDGYWLWFEVKGKRFLDRDGNRKMLFISRDISERKKYEKILKEFIVTASHQLRTPVSALVQSLDNLRKYDTQLDEDTKVKLIDVISRNISRLSELVDILLDFSEIDDKAILSSKIHESLNIEKK